MNNILNTFSISRFNEYYLPSINRHTFENLDSKTLYDKKFKQAFSHQDKLNIIVGVDSGLLANYVLESDIADGTQFIFIELEKILQFLTIDIPVNRQKNVKVLTETEFLAVLSKNDIEIYIAKGEYEIYASLGVASQHLDIYSELLNRIENKIKDEHFNHSISFTQKIFFQKQLENIADNHTPAKILKNTFPGKTCLIIAGGPSLDENIDWIKLHNNDLFIIAVARIAGKLTKNCIKFDIITCVDPQELNFDVCREIFAISNNIPLVNSYHISSKILSQWQGPSLYLGQRYPWASHGDNDNIITLGPTVTNSSVRLAIEMGFSKILLTGVDFCYSKSGFTHANGTVEANLGPNLGHDGKWIETYAGYLAETPIQLIHAMTSLAEEVKIYPEVEFINLSNSAAKIESISYINKNNIKLEKFGSKELGNVTTLSLKEKELDLKNCQQHCLKAEEKLKNLYTLIQQALKLSEKLNTNSTKAEEVITQLDKIESKINKKYSNFATLIKFYGYFEFSKFLTTRELNSWDQKQINKMTVNYYTAFNLICKDILSLVNKAKEVLRLRQQEIAPTSLITLANEWLKNGQPGRAIIWQHDHESKKLNHDEKVILTRLDTIFNKSTTQVNQVYIDALNKSSSMEQVYKKIIGLNANKNGYALSLTVKNLLPLIETDLEAKRLYHLALSFQLSLDKQTQQALDVLLALPEELCTEMELKNIILLALKLSNLELAAATLVKILAYSDEYMPQYAHILKLQGKIQQSVNVYLDYLEKYPSDTQTWIKLGLFMIEINQVEASHTAFTNATDADPNNQVAQEYLAELTRLMASSQ